jgi:hypothetical protein
LPDSLQLRRHAPKLTPTSRGRRGHGPYVGVPDPASSPRKDHPRRVDPDGTVNATPKAATSNDGRRDHQPKAELERGRMRSSSVPVALTLSRAPSDRPGCVEPDPSCRARSSVADEAHEGLAAGWIFLLLSPLACGNSIRNFGGASDAGPVAPGGDASAATDAGADAGGASAGGGTSAGGGSTAGGAAAGAAGAGNVDEGGGNNAGGGAPIGDAGASSSGLCTPGEKDCNGLQPEQCDDQGQWQTMGVLCGSLCSAGACTGMYARRRAMQWAAAPTM